MSFEPKDFLNISKELNCGTTEAHYRSLINRAYYGVFGYIRKRLPINPQDASVHREVIDFLKRSPNSNEYLVGSRLESLFKKRKEADYKYDAVVQKSSCNYSISEAEAIIEIFDKRETEE